jgi:HSP20 family protein
MARLFGEFADGLGHESWRPAVDVYETEKAVVVQVELAGVRREDLKISVDGDRLRIRGVRDPGRDEGIERLHQVEIASGPFERVLEIQIPFDRDQVSARIEDGFLRVVLRKQVPSRIRVEG